MKLGIALIASVVFLTLRLSEITVEIIVKAQKRTHMGLNLLLVKMKHMITELVLSLIRKTLFKNQKSFNVHFVIFMLRVKVVC